MKKHHSRTRFATPLLALVLTTGAMAGVTESTTTAITPAPEEEDLFSGVLNLDANSHFISYGLDVWADGSSLSNYGFNPSLELAWKLPGGFTATLGTWWDVNAKPAGLAPGVAESPIGGKIQEIDVWVGLAYNIGDFTAKVTYQNWFYASETEEVLDLALSYDTFLSPSLTIHQRLDEGGSGGQTGTIAVLGLSHSIEAGPVTFSFPFNVAYFFQDDFHPGSTDKGFGYGSIAATASMPLSFISDAYGDWSIHGGLTYYVTSSDVVANARKNDFLTANVGITVAF